MSEDHLSGKPFKASDHQVRAMFAASRKIEAQLNQLEVDNGRGKILFMGAQLEDALEQILLAFLIDDGVSREIMTGPTSPFASFSSRIKTAFALGLISREERVALDQFRKIRNEFAHKIDASCKEPKLASTILSMPGYRRGADEQIALFNVIGKLWIRLTYRPIQISARGRRRVLPEEETGNLV